MKQEGIVISPSIASANQLRLEDEARKAQYAGCSDLHIDIEDGNFIPNITFGLKTVRALRSATNLPFSFHLMTHHWQPWLQHAAALQASIVFAHMETLEYPKAFIGMAKQLGLRCGIALNPRTGAEALPYLLDDLDGLLLLTVEPDGMGEGFIPQVLEKARALRAAAPHVQLWLDGNITYERLPSLHQAGVTHAVMGRAFFG